MRKFLVPLLFILAVSIFAATTGKIVGRVYDSETGEPLPGVNVIIEGTTMGAATDEDGYFVILNVPPGDYDVTARMMGYQEMTVTDVDVQADLTKTLEFPLQSEAIAVKGVTVKAKKPIIKKDVTTSVAIVSADDMESTPVNTIQGVVARQAGIVEFGNELHARGGRGTEVVYVVNGVEMRDPMTGGYDSHIPQESVQQTSVYTGGFGAEYGGAQSGIINVVTKSGGSKFSFTLKGRTNDAFGMEGLQSFLDNNDVKDTTYLTASAADTNYGNFISVADRDYYRSIAPDGSDTVYAYVSPSGRDTALFEEPFDVLTVTQVSGRVDTIYASDMLTAAEYRPEKMKRVDFTLSGPIWGKKLRFFLGGELFKEEGFRVNSDETRQTYTGKLTFKPAQPIKVVLHGLYNTNTYKNVSATYKFFEESHRDYERESYEYGINLTHQINNRLFHELRFNNFTTSLLYNIFEDGSYDLNGDGVINEEDEDGIDDFANEDFDDSVEINGVEKPFDWPDLRIYPWTRTTNFEGFYYRGYPRLTYGYDEKHIYTLEWDLTTQIGETHEVKTGFSGKYYDLFDYGADMASGGNVYMGYTDANPYKIAGYIQDKMEMRSFVVNAGLRFDFFNANEDNLPADPTDPVVDFTSGGEIKNPVSPSSKWKISPRIGFSFPISEMDKFHFTYGHYFQVPPLNFVYYNQNYDFSGAFPMVGNPNIDPEKTVSYEVGVQHAFNDQILLDVTAYMKDISGLTDTEQIFYTAANYYTRYANGDYGHSKGIEVQFSKRRGGTPAWLTWNMNYTFGVARGKSSSTRQNYDYVWAGWVVPQKEHYLDWDQRHTVTADIGLHSPEGEALFGIPGLTNFGLNVTVNYGSGYPWTPPSRTKVQLINTERLPANWRTDLRFSKDWNLGNLRLGLFGDVYHLFEHGNITSVDGWEQYYNAYEDWNGPYRKNIHIKRYMRLGLQVKM